MLVVRPPGRMNLCIEPIKTHHEKHDIQPVICGTDFSENARQAANVAATLATRLSAPLVLVHATGLLIQGSTPEAYDAVSAAFVSACTRRPSVCGGWGRPSRKPFPPERLTRCSCNSRSRGRRACSWSPRSDCARPRAGCLAVWRSAPPSPRRCRRWWCATPCPLRHGRAGSGH